MRFLDDLGKAIAAPFQVVGDALGFRRRPQFDVPTVMGLNDQQVAARRPQVDRLSAFYQSVYGTGLSPQGIYEADYFVQHGRLMDMEGERSYDNALNFERAFDFLVQERRDALMASTRATQMGFSSAGSMANRVSARVNTFSGASAFGV